VPDPRTDPASDLLPTPNTARRQIIVGGGIGGLAVALALARHGIASDVLERRPVFAESGAGIQIGPNGTRILDWLGISDVLRPHATVPTAIEVNDGRNEGRLLAELPLGDWITRRHGSPYWVVRREDLHAALQARVAREPQVRLSMGVAVTRAVNADHGIAMAVIAADGRRWSGAGIVAADGVWSTLRTQVAPRAGEPRFAGKAAARTLLPIDALPSRFRRPVVGVWMLQGIHVVHYPVCAGAALAIIVIGPDDGGAQDWSRPAPAAWVSERTDALAPPIRELLAMGTSWHLAPLVEMPALARFNAGRIALLGDAAHPIMPFLAQGGVMALEDAAALAQAVAAVDDVAVAFQAYSDARTRRARRLASASKRTGDIYHLSGAAAAVRNAALTALPGTRIMAAYDWLYGARVVV
jgi:salicylate hydroxylase